MLQPSPFVARLVAVRNNTWTTGAFLMMTLTLGQGGISISSAVRAIYDFSLDHVDGTQIYDYLSRYATSSILNESPNLSKDPSELW
jgi:hypothetical protein